MRGETMRVRAYPVLCDAVESGIAYGLGRAYKHTDTPTQEQITAAVERAVIDAICERFEFEGEHESR